MAKFIASDVVRRSRGLKHAPGHYSLGAAKNAARKISASAKHLHPDDDVRSFASFMPMGISARVISWPKL
nr:hypothetical protein [Comamonas thiooxydans]